MVGWFRRRGTEEQAEDAEPEEGAVVEGGAAAVEPDEPPPGKEAESGRGWFRRRGQGEAEIQEDDAEGEESAQDEGPAADLEQGLARTRQGFFSRIGQWLRRGKLDEESWEELEELLIQADVGVETTLELVERMRERVREQHIQDFEGLQRALSEELVSMLEAVRRPLPAPQPGVPYVILTVGVNGVGKTTTIAKLAHHYRRQGYAVLLAAADTFRAAA
ncbi:MAG: signal recognition particle receptor subunit alpha, partial [Chloroflexia bacterium]|nr:signal recognition particle receptor subunit alpha [Chloroflexia bacterium]